METNENYSLLALFITALILFKGITAFGMWTEKDWAIKFGIIDAAIGVVTCVIMMFIEPLFENTEGSWNINFRFELLFLLPYFFKCLKIRQQWDSVTKLTLPEMSTTESSKVNNEPINVVSNIENENHTVIEEKNNTEQMIDKEDHSRFMPK